MHEPRAPRRAIASLVIAMSVVALCFAFSIAYALASARKNHLDVLELRENAAPSIAQLTLVRNDLRKLDAGVHTATKLRTRAPAIAAVRAGIEADAETMRPRGD